MPRKKVCILECSKENQKLFQFPDEAYQKPRRDLWIRQLNVQKPTPKFIYACERHFSDAMLRTHRRYPDQNLVAQTNTEGSDSDSNSIHLPTILSSPPTPPQQLTPPVANSHKAPTMIAKNPLRFDNASYIESNKCNGDSIEMILNNKGCDSQTVICCVLKCTGKDRSYFSFPDPERQPERRKEWLRRLGISGSQPRLLYACDRHFSESMRVRSNLRLQAVPDQNICIDDTNIEGEPVIPIIPPPNFDHDYIRKPTLPLAWPYKTTEVSFLPVKPASNNNAEQEQQQQQQQYDLNNINAKAITTATTTSSTISTKQYKSVSPIVRLPIHLPLVCLPEHKKLDEKEVAVYTKTPATTKATTTNVCTSNDIECDIVPYAISINKNKPAQHQIPESQKQKQANLTDLGHLPILQKPHTLTTFPNEVKGIAIPLETTQLQPSDPLSIDIHIDPSFLNGVNGEISPHPIVTAQKTCDPQSIDIRIDPIFANEIKEESAISSCAETKIATQKAANKMPTIEYYGLDSLPILPSFADYKKAKYTAVVGRCVQTDKYLLDRMPDRKKMIDELTELRRKVKDQAQEIKRITLENELLITELDVIKTKNAERNLFY